MGILDPACLSLGHGDGKPLGARFVALVQTQLQGPAQGEEIVRIRLPRIHEVAQRLGDVPQVELRQGPVVPRWGDGDAVQHAGGAGEIMGLHVHLADIELREDLRGGKGAVGLKPQLVPGPKPPG